jgi:hypothetical protein
MVKLQVTKKGSYQFSVPIEKIKRAKLSGGDLFDIDITSEGNLIFVKIKK